MLQTSLLDRLKADFPAISFTESNDFSWQPTEATVTYSVSDTHFNEHLLHELAHAVLKHASYDRDIDLIAMERDAWAHARLHLGPQYATPIEIDLIQTDMDTYRDWLHARSTCPRCDATGLQIKKKTYRCVSCRHSWQVNEAKMCRLRRYTMNKNEKNLSQ